MVLQKSSKRLIAHQFRGQIPSQTDLQVQMKNISWKITWKCTEIYTNNKIKLYQEIDLLLVRKIDMDSRGCLCMLFAIQRNSVPMKSFCFRFYFLEAGGGVFTSPIFWTWLRAASPHSTICALTYVFSNWKQRYLNLLKIEWSASQSCQPIIFSRFRTDQRIWNFLVWLTLTSGVTWKMKMRYLWYIMYRDIDDILLLQLRLSLYAYFVALFRIEKTLNKGFVERIS